MRSRHFTSRQPRRCQGWHLAVLAAGSLVCSCGQETVLLDGQRDEIPVDDIYRPEPLLTGIPSRANWARLDLPHRPRTPVVPRVGTSTVRIGNTERDLSTPSGEALTVWSVSRFLDSDLLCIGWTTTSEQCVLAHYTIKYAPELTVQCTDILYTGMDLHGTAIVQWHPAFPNLIVVFDQSSHDLYYFDVTRRELRRVMTAEEVPGLSRMAFMYLLSSKVDDAGRAAALGIHMQGEITRGLGAPEDPAPWGFLHDTDGDGKFERVDFHVIPE